MESYKIKNARFNTSVALGQPYITGGVQIAVVGKSNVGKSSFINAVCKNGKLARTSANPGKTRLINYFDINGGEFMLVDLPGYGFAKAPKSEQEKWGELIESCLRSGNINHIFMLLDSRHEPTVQDRQMFSWIQYYCIPHTIIGTKVDKLAKTKRKPAVAALNRQLGSVSPAIAFSAEDGFGMNDILERISQIVNDVALIRPDSESEE